MNRQEIEADFKLMSSRAFAHKYGIHHSTFRTRVRMQPDASVVDLIYKPCAERRKKLKLGKEKITIRCLANRMNMSFSTMRNLLIKYDGNADKLVKNEKAGPKVDPVKYAEREEKTNLQFASSDFSPLTDQQMIQMLVHSWREDGANDDQIEFRIRSWVMASK